MDSEAGVLLESPMGKAKHNCYGVVFDGGITVIQKNMRTDGVCKDKLVVQSPTIILDQSDGQYPYSVEADCLEIGEPEFDSQNSQNAGDKATGTANARTFALASLDKPAAVITLDRLDIFQFKGGFSRGELDGAELCQRMTTFMARKAQGSATTDAGVLLQELFGKDVAS